MAKNKWRGDAQPVAGVDTLTIGGTPAAGNTVAVTINRKEIKYTAISGDTTSTIAANLQALLTNAGLAEFAEKTWSVLTNVVTATDTTPGVPVTMTVAATGGGATITLATVTATTGPNFGDNAANWTLNAAPSGTDDIVLEGESPILYGLTDWTVNSVDCRGAFTAGVGLPEWNEAGYYEYRTRSLKWDCANVKVGEGPGAGSSALFVSGVASSTWKIFGTSTRATDAVPALDIKFTGNPTLVTIAGGDVGIGVTDESVSPTIATVAISGEGSRLTLGRTVTVTALDQDNGTTATFGTVTTAGITAGNYTQEDGTLTTLNADGGYIRLRQGGTVATCTARGQSTDGQISPVVDCTDNQFARTFTNHSFTGGAALYDGNNTVAFTNAGTWDRASLNNSDLGTRFLIQRT